MKILHQMYNLLIIVLSIQVSYSFILKPKLFSKVDFLFLNSILNDVGDAQLYNRCNLINIFGRLAEHKALGYTSSFNVSSFKFKNLKSKEMQEN